MKKETYSILSANTLFHFTNKFENVESILENGFYPRYSYEDHSTSTPSNQGHPDYAIAMVCFCDIPLSQIKDHMETYGSYGIGLSKDWGIKHGVCPVIYTYPGSLLANELGKILEIYNNDDAPGNLVDLHLGFVRLSKPYQGYRYNRNKRQYDDKLKRFYDEREWRYLPSTEKVYKVGGGISPIYLSDTVKDDLLIEQSQKVLEHKDVRLPIDFNKVKYIIVKTRREVIEIMDTIQSLKISERKRKILITKIISAEDIKQDF